MVPLLLANPNHDRIGKRKQWEIARSHAEPSDDGGRLRSIRSHARPHHAVLGVTKKTPRPPRHPCHAGSELVERTTEQSISLVTDPGPVRIAYSWLSVASCVAVVIASRSLTAKGLLRPSDRPFVVSNNPSSKLLQLLWLA